MLFSQFILMSRKDRLIIYNTRTKKECETHHFRFPPNLVELLHAWRKENFQILGSNSKLFQSYGNSKIGLLFLDFTSWLPSWISRLCRICHIPYLLNALLDFLKNWYLTIFEVLNPKMKREYTISNRKMIFFHI